MCGIFGYTGKQNALPILLEGLRILEYRGYDSAGIFITGNAAIKAAGGLENLRKKTTQGIEGSCGIAHLRWATHGEATEQNAHPHTDCSGTIALVHNGIFENYKEIKKQLAEQGHSFASETDTEVIAHLIEEKCDSEKTFLSAVVSALREIRGAYALAITCENEPGTIVVARNGAPVVVGIGSDEYFVASDVSPLLPYTKEVFYLEDGEIAVLTEASFEVTNFSGIKSVRSSETITWTSEQAEKEGYEHFMLKEIMEGPRVVSHTLLGRIQNGKVFLPELDVIQNTLRDVRRIIVVGCGTAYYAGLIAEYLLEQYAGIPVEVEIGSEFRYRKPIVEKETLVLVISQSGETADTLEAVREAKRSGAHTLGIINTVGSSIAREVDTVLYNHAGPEIGVASTKALLSQITLLLLLTLFFRKQRGHTTTEDTLFIEEFLQLPKKIESILKQKELVWRVAKNYSDAKDFLYMGRNVLFPVALEGALKLKEVSYIHAEGYGAGEMKHGPLAMIDERFPTFALAPLDELYEKVLSNIQEIRARRGKVIALTSEGAVGVEELATDVLYVPQSSHLFLPILYLVPLQLFAYYVASEKGFDVDHPRNLAKSVTVE